MADREEYLLGTSDEELERLGYQHQVWLDEAIHLWKLASFRSGHRVADLGCGPGFATLDLARLVGPEGRIEAVEASEKYLRYLEKQLQSCRLNQVEIHQGDVHALPLPDSSLDGVFMRWVLCFVEDPHRVVSEIARALKPGASVAIMDYFNYLSAGVFPRGKVVNSVFQAYHESVQNHGGSYDIGNRLPRLLLDHGLEIQSLEPICRIARPGSREWHWVSLFNRVYTPLLVEQGLWSEDQLLDFREQWRRAARDTATFFFTPPMVGIVAKKP